MDVRELLEQVKSGAVGIEDAEKALKDLPYEDLGYAKLDHHRKLRSGFGETVFCQGKPDAYLMEIYKRFYERDGEVLGTRASEEQHVLVKSAVPEVVYDPISRILKVERRGKERKGLIAVCTGGTADIPVAEEAAQTAEYFGCAGPDLRCGGGGNPQAAFTAGQDYESQLYCCGGGNGRRPGDRDCRACGLPGHCGPHIGGIWGQLSWTVCSFDHAEFLCQRDFSGEY